MKRIFTLLSVLTAMILLPFAANAQTYTVAGSAAVLNGDASWAQANEANDMTTEDGTVYTLTISGINVETGTYEFKVVQDHEWTNCWPSSNYVITISETAKYDIVYSFNADTKEIGVVATKVGDFDGSTDKIYTVAGSAAVLGSSWGQTDTNNEMVKGEDGIYRLVKENVELTSGTTYEYKVVVNHDWGTAYPSVNATFTVSEDGKYNVTFTFDESSKVVNAIAEAVVETVVFDFTTDALRGYVGTTMTDVNGYIYNETYTIDGVSLQVTAGAAPSRIYEDANRGVNLVIYNNYGTMTFCAPQGMTITKIVFTAAGNSNINKFTPTSGTVDGMVWEGNAEGVRFTQGATSYLANAIVTVTNKNAETVALAPIEYVECANIAAFNALEVGEYAKVMLNDAEVIGKSADGYSTVWIQDVTGGCWIQYTSLNNRLTEGTKVNGFVYVAKRSTSGNPQMKESVDTPASEIASREIDEFTAITGNTIAEINVPENLNRVVKLYNVSFVATSATAGTLTLGGETINVNNGTATANQQLHMLEWAKDDTMENVNVVGILVATSATDASKNQLLPISMVDSVVDGISNVNAANADVQIYNLQGVRMNKVQKGVNIVNGKKVVVK